MYYAAGEPVASTIVGRQSDGREGLAMFPVGEERLVVEARLELGGQRG